MQFLSIHHAGSARGAPRTGPEAQLPRNQAAPAAAESLDFESAVRELESIVARMESDGLPLEESLAAYRRGVELVRAAQARLAAVEQQVKVLEEGVLRPLDDDGAAA
jgi:exodeoxyribonuclease VII small subunit